jgi:hypothetical protein
MANFTQEGSAFLLNQLAKGTTAGGGTIVADALYVGLATVAPTATSTLATITEHTTVGGYARKNWTSANATISGAGVLSMGAAVQWGTGITLTNATHWFVCTTASGTTGKIFCWGALSATRSLTTADSLTENITSISIS